MKKYLLHHLHEVKPIVLKCLASGSKGNCYSLTDSEGNILLLDVGIPIKDIKIGIDFQVSKVCGALISHGHQDHNYALKDLEKMGIPIVAPYMGKPKVDQFSKGYFFVQYFALTDKEGKFVHTNGDGSECPIYGFYIWHDKEPFRMVYVTDCEFIKWRFKGINNLLVGIDYMDEYLALEDNEAKKRHILSGHLELNTAVDFIKVTDRDHTLNNVIVGHLSESNSNTLTFEKAIRKVTQSNIYFARKGKSYQL